MIKDGFNSINDSLRKFAKKLGQDIVVAKEKEIKAAPPENQIFQVTKNGFESIAKTIESIDMHQPEDGKPGHTPTDTELLAIIKPLIPKLRQPEDGHTPTKEEILALIKPLIPEVKNGETPSDERLIALINPLIPEIKIDEAGIVKKVVKTLEPMIPRVESADALAVKLATKKEPWLPIEAIKGDWSRFWPKVVGAISSLRQLTDVDYSGLDQDTKGNYILSSGKKRYSELEDVNMAGLADGNMPIWDETAGKWIPGTPTDTDEKVKYDASDPTAGYVADKFVAGTGIALEEGGGVDANKLVISNTIVAFRNLLDVPQDYSPNAGKTLVVNSTEDGLEYVDFPTPDLSGYFNKTTDDTDDITDTADNRYTNDTDITRLSNTSGTNTGDQDLSDFLTDAPADTKTYGRKDNAWAEVVTITKNTITFQVSCENYGYVSAGIKKPYLDIPFDCNITEYSLIANEPCSLVLDVLRRHDDFPTSSDSIMGSSKPTLATAQKVRVSSLDIDLAKNDILAFKVETGLSNVTGFSLVMTYNK
jgi:hypothetical protein